MEKAGSISFEFTEKTGDVETNYRVTENGSTYQVERSDILIAELRQHNEVWEQISGKPLDPQQIFVIGDMIACERPPIIEFITKVIKL